MPSGHHAKIRLFVVSSGFDQILYGGSEQVDDPDEGFIVSVPVRPHLGRLEDPVERFDPCIAVFRDSHRATMAELYFSEIWGHHAYLVRKQVCFLRSNNRRDKIP